jgi:hypothetical protein
MDGIPSIFGNGAFTFMVHHSIPGLVFPLQNEKSAPRAIAWAYAVSFVLYVLVGLLALWSFNHVEWILRKHTVAPMHHSRTIQHELCQLR